MPKERLKDGTKRARKGAERRVDYARRQASGTRENAGDLAERFGVDDILPAGVRGFISELFMLVPYALGRGSAYKQITASVTLIILAFLATPFTLGYSAALAAAPAITLVWGLLRAVPAINRRYREARGDKLRNRDIPLWNRD